MMHRPLKLLKLDDLHNVVNAWKENILRNSPLNKNIGCDTGCILLVYHIAIRKDT